MPSIMSLSWERTTLCALLTCLATSMKSSRPIRNGRILGRLLSICESYCSADSTFTSLMLSEPQEWSSSASGFILAFWKLHLDSWLWSMIHQKWQTFGTQQRRDDHSDTFRWTQLLPQCVQTILLGCTNTSYIIWCQTWPPPQHCNWCQLWWVWRTQTSHVCFVRLKPSGSMSRIQLCTSYILLLQFFHWCFHRTRSQLEDGSIIMCTDAFPAFLWAGNPPGCDFNEDNMLDRLFKGYLPLCVHSKFLSNDTVCHCQEIRLQSIYSSSKSCGLHPCNAILHDMITVEPEHITYTCILVSSVWTSGPRTAKGPRTRPGLDQFRTGLQSWSYPILKSISPGPLLF